MIKSLFSKNTKLNNKKNLMYEAYLVGVAKRKQDKDKQKSEKHIERTTNEGIDNYIIRMEIKKQEKFKEREKRRIKIEEEKLKENSYKKNYIILGIWEQIEKEISKKLLEWAIPNIMHITIKSENNNLTAMLTHTDLKQGTTQVIIQQSGPYSIPKELDEKIVIKVLQELCNESLMRPVNY